MPREKICAVYVIRNKANGKVYVGGSKDVMLRRNDHFGKLKRGVHRSRDMIADYREHGRDAFEFSILELATPETLAGLEQKWLDVYRGAHPWYGYNSWPNARSAKGAIRRPEDIAKIRGRIKTRTYSEDGRRRWLESHTKVYEVTSPDGETFLVKNLSEFCRQNGLTDANMNMVAAGKRKTAKGWTCRKLEPFLGENI